MKQSIKDFPVLVAGTGFSGQVFMAFVCIPCTTDLKINVKDLKLNAHIKYSHISRGKLMTTLNISFAYIFEIIALAGILSFYLLKPRLSHAFK